MKIKIRLLAPLMALGMSLPASAQDTTMALKGDIRLEKVTVDANGQKKIELVPPTTIIPGDRLIFGTDYVNNGAEKIENFVVTNTLPAAVRLADDADPTIVVSVDGGNKWGILSSLTVVGADGAPRKAGPADVTHIRWTLASVAPGSGGHLQYPAIIR